MASDAAAVVRRLVSRVLLGDDWAEPPRSDDVDRRIVARQAGTLAAGIAALFAAVLVLPAANGDRVFIAAALLLPVGASPVYFRYGERLPWWLSNVLGVTAGLALVIISLHGGPLRATVPAIYVLLGISFMGMRRVKASAALVGAVAACYAVSLWLTPDLDQPVARWVSVVGAILACGTLVRLLASSLLALTFSERAERDEAEEMASALHVAGEEMSAFMARMSHELRTPLNAIVGFAAVLRQGYGGELTAQQTAYVDDIAESAQHLVGLVDDVLDPSRAESGDVDLEYSDVLLDELIEDCISVMRPGADRVAVTISRRALPVHVWVDKRRISQVILNLVSNGVRFAGAGGWVSVEATVSEGRLRVRVVDSGPGVASIDRDRIFEPYEQAAGVSDGTGLGLAVARKLVHAHGGSLVLDERGAHGAVFEFDVPARPEAFVDTAAETPEGVSGNPLYVAFTAPGSARNRQLVARTGVWFALCAGVYATVLAVVAQTTWVWRAGFTLGGALAAATALGLSRRSQNVSRLGVEALGYLGVFSLCGVAMLAQAYADLAVIPFAWFPLAGWALWRQKRVLVLGVLAAALYLSTVMAAGNDPLEWVHWLTLVFMMMVAAMIARTLVIELTRALAAEGRARARAKDLQVQLEGANQHRSTFLASMSHELRTPLNAVLGFADLLQEEIGGPLDEKQRQYVTDIREAGAHLLRLINDILDLAKMDAGQRTESEIFCVRGVFELAAVNADLVASRCDVQIVVDGADELLVAGDRHQLSVAAQHLVTTAVLRSPAGGEVKVCLTDTSTGPQVCIVDHGATFDVEEADRVFDPFHYAPGMTPRVEGGTGLELALARGAADAHGGRLEVRSGALEGATFTMRLPARRGDHEASSLVGVRARG